MMCEDSTISRQSKARRGFTDRSLPASPLPIFRLITYTVSVKIGSVPYLNARPLVDWLQRNPQPGVELCYAHPSQLIPALFAGELDVAMASTFALLEHPSWLLLSGLGITVRGRAASVRLLSTKPPGEITTLALDRSSRSSVVLARIVLADGYGVTPQVIDMPPDPQAMLARADGAVLIGDVGLAMSGEGLFDLDLGSAWWDLTGLPFYFAGWIARDERALASVAPLLYRSSEYGLARLPAIAEKSAIALHLPEDLCVDYLMNVMQYRAGEPEVAGLHEFAVRADRHGFIDQLQPIHVWQGKNDSI